MPKRRKRNISGTRLRPLEFESSPVNIVHGIPSPVYASDHPATADVIALDGTIPVPWVSPQFVGEPTPCTGRSRRTRRTRSQMDTIPLTRSRLKHNQTGNLTSIPDLPRNADKFRSLKFLGEETTINSESQCEEDDAITVDENEYVAQFEAVTPKQITCHRESSRNDSSRWTGLKEQENMNDMDPTGFDFDTPKAAGSSSPDKSPVVRKHSDRKAKHKSSSTDCDKDYKISPNDVNQEVLSQEQCDKAKTSLSSSDVTSNREHSSGTMKTTASLSRSKLDHIEKVFFPSSQTFGTPENHKVSNIKVLAYDTPEEEYGMPVRLRRRRALRSRQR